MAGSSRSTTEARANASGEVGGRLGDADAADGRDEEVGAFGDLHPRATGEDGHQEVGPTGVDAQGVGSRGADGPGAEQGLHLDQQRAAALEDRHHRAARHPVHAIPQHERPGIGHGAQAVVAHLEDADLAGGAEAMLDRGEDPQGVMAVPVEGEHRVDEMLDRAGPGEVSVLRHVSHQEQRHAAGLCHAGQALDAGAHLGQAARRLGQLGVRDRLERVDHEQRRVVALDGRLDLLDVGPLQREEVTGHQTEARRAPPHLGE